PTETSPATVVRRALATSARLIEPCELSTTTSPSGPVDCSSALAALTSTCEPAGSSTLTATEPLGPKYWFLAVTVIRSTPSAYSTWASSATFTSRPFDGSAGSTSTTVSARSAATSW